MRWPRVSTSRQAPASRCAAPGRSEEGGGAPHHDQQRQLWVPRPREAERLIGPVSAGGRAARKTTAQSFQRSLTGCLRAQHGESETAKRGSRRSREPFLF